MNRTNQFGQRVVNRASTPLFETSLKKCLLLYNFSEADIRDVIEKPEGKGGKAKNTGKGGKGGRGGWGGRAHDAHWGRG